MLLVLWHEYIKHDMARHVSNFYLNLNQLWRCPASWCTQWKGTPQDCVDHIRKKHFVYDSVKAANLGRWFPPWTVTRTAWHTALKSKVSGVSMDVDLTGMNGSQLVHHYRVFRQCAAHVSLRGTFIIDLRCFTSWASADAKWAARRNRTLATGSPSPSYSPEPLPRIIRQRGLDDESPACKAPRAVSPVRTDRSVHAATSTITSADKYSDPAVPELRSIPYGGRPRRPRLHVSLPLPRFADRTFVPSPVRSSSVFM